MPIYNKFSAIVTIGVVSVALASMLPTIASAQTDGYLTNQALESQIRTLTSSDAHARASTIGTSLDGTPIHLITLAGSADSADQHPAMLITAGIDGRYLLSTEAAMNITQQLLTDHADLLQTMTSISFPVPTQTEPPAISTHSRWDTEETADPPTTTVTEQPTKTHQTISTTTASSP